MCFIYFSTIFFKRNYVLSVLFFSFEYYAILYEFILNHFNSNLLQTLLSYSFTFSACKFSINESPFLLAMCGKLSFQINKDIQHSFSLLVRAQHFNELKNNNVTSNTQKQLRVFVLYQISVNCAKIVIQELRKFTHGNDEEHSSYLSDDVIAMLEECSFTRPVVPSTTSGNSNNRVMGESNNQDMAMDTMDVSMTENPSLHVQQDTSLSFSDSTFTSTSQTFTQPHTQAPTHTHVQPPRSSAEDTLKLERLWRLLSSSIAGLVDCRRIDPYHSLSVHKISTVLRTLSHLEILPPKGMQDIYPLTVRTAAATATTLTTLSNSSVLKPTLTETAADSTHVSAVIPDTSSNILLGASDLLPNESQPCSTRSVADNPDPAKPPTLPAGLEISVQGAFNESQKLFEKKRLQIVALWCLETATNGCERILQRTYKFDSLRRKIILQYFELAVLCDNYTAILTVLNWTLSVTCKLLTATLKWVLKLAVKCCSAILRNHHTLLIKDLEEVELNRCITSTADCENNGSSMCISATSESNGFANISVESSNQGGPGSVPMQIQSDDFLSSTAVTDNAAASALDAAACSSNVTPSTYSTCSSSAIPKGPASNEGPQGIVLSPTSQLLKRAYDLYNLVSKVLDPSDMTAIEDVIVQIFSLTENQGVRQKDQSVPVSVPVSTTAHASGQCDAGDNNVAVDDNNQAKNGDFRPLIPRNITYVLTECAGMWSSKPVGGVKRSRTSSSSRTSAGAAAIAAAAADTSATASASITATAATATTASTTVSALVSQSSSLSSSDPAESEGMERPCKISKGSDDV